MREHDEAIRFLFGLQGFGVKLGLTNIRRLLDEMGDPHHAIPSVHIAGSNGKGSTSAFLSSVLMEAGLTTGLYTSPHLVDFRERIRVNGGMVSRRFVTDWVRKHRRRILQRKITFFEATTALAFDWFRSRAVDVAVIETGLGGRLDATNVLDPLLTIITSISLEHTHILGHDLRSIAREKAGIGKPGVPFVLGPVPEDLRRYLRSFLRKRGVPVVPDAAIRVTRSSGSSDRTVFRVRSSRFSLDRVGSGLPGAHQGMNIRTVLQAVDVLRTSYGMRITDSHIRDGIRRVRENTAIEGRCTEVKGQKRLFADVAHNPEAMHKTAQYFLRETGIRRLEVIFGISADKDVRAVLRELKPVVGEITIVAASNTRSRDVNSILRTCSRLSIIARSGGSVRQGLRQVLLDKRRRPVLITGSHFVVGEALAMLRRRKYLTITQ